MILLQLLNLSNKYTKVVLNMEKKDLESDTPEQEKLAERQQTNNQAVSMPQPFAFGSQPISLKCPFCHQRVRTQIIMKPQLISIMLGLVMFSFLPNAIMIVLIAVALQVTATKRHRCSLCQRQLGSDGKFLGHFVDGVYSFQFGDNGVIVSRKIIVTVGLFILMILVMYVRATAAASYQWIDMAWQDLIRKCPIKQSQPYCNNENFDKTVKNWKGWVMRVEDRRDSYRRYYQNALEIYIKMSPTQTNSKTPDLYLTASTSSLSSFAQVLDTLNHGDEIIFNATFQPIGRGIPTHAHNRHLQLVDLNKTSNHDDGIQIYMNKKEEQYYSQKVEGKVEGKGLRMEMKGAEERK